MAPSWRPSGSDRSTAQSAESQGQIDDQRQHKNRHHARRQIRLARWRQPKAGHGPGESDVAIAADEADRRRRSQAQPEKDQAADHTNGKSHEYRGHEDTSESCWVAAPMT